MTVAAELIDDPAGGSKMLVQPIEYDSEALEQQQRSAG